jgi:hypothetical protein
MNLRTPLLLTTLAMLFVHTTASAALQTIYKCKSAQGVPQYVALAIAGQQCQKITLDGRLPPSAMIAARPTPAAPSKTPSATPTQAPQKTNQGSHKLSPTECQQIQQANDTLATGKRIYETDEKGERRYLDDHAVSQRKQQYQELATTGCQ